MRHRTYKYYKQKIFGDIYDAGHKLRPKWVFLEMLGFIYK